MNWFINMYLCNLFVSRKVLNSYECNDNQSVCVVFLLNGTQKCRQWKTWYLLCKVSYFLWPEMWRKQLEVENGTVQHKDWVIGEVKILKLLKLWFLVWCKLWIRHMKLDQGQNVLCDQRFTVSLVCIN